MRGGFTTLEDVTNVVLYNVSGLPIFLVLYTVVGRSPFVFSFVPRSKSQRVS